MARIFSQFYFTKEDPDYSIKGSRDPLAFQVLWQHQGRKLIPYLSTVSNNLNDFQILCLAYYFYNKEPDNAFVRFFLRFEQLMAYVRLEADKNARFNGVEKAKNKLKENPNRISVSNTSEDEILSNQRSYGIWGKYNRPFHDIKFILNTSFKDVFDEKINSLFDVNSVRRIIAKTMSNNQSRFNIDELECLKILLNFTKTEKSFYQDLILKIELANSYQNQLYHFISNNSFPKDLDLYPFLEFFSSELSQDDGELISILKDIECTEKVLCPLNRIFRYLQTKPIWERNEIINDEYISVFKNPLDYIFEGGNEECKIKNHLNQSMKKDNWGLIEDLAVKNKEVTEWRGGAPWITINDNLLEVHHAEGGYYNPEFDPEKDFDNDYFLRTYFNLYRQSQTS